MKLLTAALLVSLATGFAGFANAAEAPEAARRLAQDAVIVDTHIDAPGELLDHWNDLGLPTPTRQFDYPRARAGGLDVAFMSIYTSADEDDQGKAWQIAQTQIDAVEALTARHPDKFALLRSPKDVQELQRGERHAGELLQRRQRGIGPAL